VNIPLVGLVALAVILLIVVLSVTVEQYFVISRERDYYEMVLKPENPQLIELHASEEARLNSYKLVDPAKGVWQIPIDSAIKLEAAEAKQDQTSPQSSVTQTISTKKTE
jgi:hypothetical protein